jgi:hypothetical protein
MRRELDPGLAGAAGRSPLRARSARGLQPFLVTSQERVLAGPAAPNGPGPPGRPS